MGWLMRVLVPDEAVRRIGSVRPSVRQALQALYAENRRQFIRALREENDRALLAVFGPCEAG